MCTPQPRRPRGGKPVIQEAELLSAALSAFARLGYHGTSLRSLNRELGVSHNLLTQQFGSKEALWRAAVDWGFGRMQQSLTQATEDSATENTGTGEATRTAEESGPTAALHRFIEAFVLQSARMPELLALVNAEGSQHSERLDYLLEHFGQPMFARMQPIYAQAVAAGELREVPLETLFYLITAGGASLYSTPALSTKLFGAESLAPDQVQSQARSVADFLIAGLRSEAAPSDSTLKP